MYAPTTNGKKPSSNSTKIGNDSSTVQKGQTASTSSKTSKQSEPLPGTVRHCQRLIGALNFDNFPTGKSKLRLLQKELLELDSEKPPNAYAILFRAIIEVTFYEYCNINQLQTKDRLIDKIKAAYNNILNKLQGDARTEKERELQNAFSSLVDPNSCISTAVLNVITHRSRSSSIPYNLRMGIFNTLPLLHEIGM